MNQYEKTKLSAVKWQELAAQAYRDGDMAHQKIYHEYMVADIEFMSVLRWPEPPTELYVRLGDVNNASNTMLPIGPHQTLNKAHYEKLVRKESSRYNADDAKVLSSSEAG